MNLPPPPMNSLEEIAPPPTIKWLPVPKAVTHLRRLPQELGCLENIVQHKEMLSRLFEIYEYSIPPFLDKRYHTMNVSKLMKIDRNQHYQAVAAWFVCYCESFGLQYLNNVQVKQYSLATKIIKGEDLETIRHQLDLFKYWLTRNGVFKSYPTSADEASKPEEILLEPCVIIQLPWNTVLFHQWLIAALAQVYLFEKESLELRHWPLPVEIEPYARDFLFLVKQLKERVIFGFNILSKQVNIYPKVETQHPGWILDQVVLPSLATLQFLTSGKADEVLRSIKKTAWSKCEGQEELEKRIYVPKDCYDYKMGEWADVYHNLYINCMYWSKGDSYGPFGFWCEDYETEGYEIRRDDVTKSSCDTAEDSTQRKASKFKEKGVDEGGMYHVMNCRLGNVDKPSEIEARVKLAVDVVRKVFEAKLLPPRKLKSCIEMFDCDLVRQNIGNHKKSKKNLTELQVAVIEHARLYNDMCVKLIGSETQKGVLSRVVNLQFEILEKEQLVRIAHYLGCFLNVTPMISHSEKSTSMEFKTATEIMKEVCDSQESHDRDWLWSQFSEEWRKPVERHEIDLDMTLPDLVEHFETRIGRLVVNTAQKCFEVFEKGGDIFQHLQMIQYIFPCYISLHVKLLQDSKNDKFLIENSITFLHHLFQYYEQLYETWHTNITQRKVETSAISWRQSTELYLTLSHIREHANFILLASIGKVDDSSFVYRLENINDGLLGWIEFTSLSAKSSLVLCESIKTWTMKITNIYKVIRNVCIQAFHVPSPGSLFQNKMLEKTYFTNAIMSTLENVYFKSVSHPDGTDRASIKRMLEIKKKVENMTDIRLRLFLVIVHGVEKNLMLLNMDLQVLNNTFSLNYQTLKKYKKILGPSTIHHMEDLPDDPPELKIAALHYLKNEFEPLEKMLGILPPQQLMMQAMFMESLFSAASRPAPRPSSATTAARQNISSKAPRPSSASTAERQNTSSDAAKPSSATTAEKSGTSSTATKPSTSSTAEKMSEKKPTVASTSHPVPKTPKSNPVPPKKCRNCPRTEEKRGTFLTCEKCREQKYPDVNFYCSKSCKYAWWKAEHMAEHLEFELGLSDFSHLKLDEEPAETKGDKAGPSK